MTCMFKKVQNTSMGFANVRVKKPDAHLIWFQESWEHHLAAGNASTFHSAKTGH